MEDGQPSRTALATAAARAAHLAVDQEPWIFEDRLAAVLLGELADELTAVHRANPTAEGPAVMRVAMTTRSRYAENHLAEAVGRGTDQYVLLGAGLDSFAYRSPLAQQLTVFEVDHPATQAWKRARLADAGISVPDQVRFVPVDFAIDSLGDRLAEQDFDPSRLAFVSWLGVTQYLTREAIGATVDEISALSAGAELVVEYLVPAEMRDDAGRIGAEMFMPRAAAWGEPWVTFLTPSDVARLLTTHGMTVVDDVSRKDQIDSRLWERSDALHPHEMGRLVWAVTAR